MKLSISISEKAPSQAPFVLKGSWCKEIEQAADIGFDAVELHIRDPHQIPTDQIIEQTLQRNISISSIGTGLGYGLDQLSLSHKDDSVRNCAIERLKSQIKLASEFNSLVIIGLMKGQVKDSGSYEAFENNVKEGLAQCLNYAETLQVPIVLEAINRYESDVLNTFESTVSFIKTFQSPLLKLHIDAFHMNMEESSIQESILHVKEFIGHVHVADNNRMYPGHGCFDFSTFFQSLRTIDYHGYIAIECLDLPEPKIAATEAYRYLKEKIQTPTS